jgi:hypothetical protein
MCLEVEVEVRMEFCELGWVGWIRGIWKEGAGG